MRRLGVVLAVVVLAAVGAFAAISFFNARDDAGVGAPAAQAPGTAVAELGVQAPETQPGNVVLLYSDDAQRADLQALAEDIAGPASPELEQAGQAVLVRKDAAAGGIVAVADGRGVRVRDPGDPQLRTFVEGELGAR